MPPTCNAGFTILNRSTYDRVSLRPNGTRGRTGQSPAGTRILSLPMYPELSDGANQSGSLDAMTAFGQPIADVEPVGATTSMASVTVTD